MNVEEYIRSLLEEEKEDWKITSYEARGTEDYSKLAHIHGARIKLLTKIIKFIEGDTNE